MLRVFIEDLEFYAYHGVSDEEQAIGHRYIATVSVQASEGAEASDRIKDTVNYATLGLVIQEAAAATKVRTLEHLGSLICDEVLAKFSNVQEVTLKLAKRLPPAPLIAREAGIEITKCR